MKKLLFVNFSKDWGGGEKWYKVTAERLQKRGYEIVFYGRNNSKLQENVNHPFLCDTISSMSFLNPIKLFRVVRKLKSVKPDVVILNSSRELKSIAPIAKLMKIDKIIYRRGILNTISPSFINKFILRRCITDYVANSKHTTYSFAKILSPEKVNVIYNGIEDTVEQNQINYSTNKLAIVSRLSEEKGIDLGIKAFNETLKDNPNAELHIFGIGAERENLDQLVTKLNIGDRVFFKGFTNNVSEELKNYSLLLLPSRKEGFGYVLLEAMSNSLACIAFKGNSAEEIIVDKESGFLIDAFDVVEMGKKINHVLQNEALASQFGQYGKKRLQEVFTIDKSIDKFAEILEA